MAIKISSTKDAAVDNGIKMLVYGNSGAGKTYLCGTWDNERTLIISAEGGVMTLHDKDIPVVEIRNMDDLRSTFDYLASKDGSKFELICFDSISEIAEVCLADEMTKTKDGRKAYMELGTIMKKLIRAFRDLPGKHVLMIAKSELAKDEMTGGMIYSPAMPGAKLAQSLPYFFDIVMPLRIEKDQEGVQHRYLVTQADAQWVAKDRSGRLPQFVDADLTKIIDTIGGAA